MRKIKVAVFGTGYWAQFQIAAWQSMGAEVVSVWNRTCSRAEDTACRFGIRRVYEEPEKVFEGVPFDIADIITEAGGHERLTVMAASYGKPVICQKPMADTADSCDAMLRMCKSMGVWFAIHENYRYQPPLMKAIEVLKSGLIGRPIIAHLQLYSNSREMLLKQPALLNMDHMALRDVGPHIFDVARCLFGDAESVYSIPIRSYSEIDADDSAKTIIKMKSGLVLGCDLVRVIDHFLLVEGEYGVLRLGGDHKLTIVSNGHVREIETGTWPRLGYIPDGDWALHGWHVFHSIPICLQKLTENFVSGRPAETSGEDNRETMRMVFAAIRSQDENRPVRLDEPGI